MLDEPYRWVEAIRNRREYVEDQLKTASPVVGRAYENGLLLVTTTPGPRKLFEVYNQLAFAAIGHPADIEKLRKAVIDIAHLEAFNLSSRDVSLQRLVHFGIGPLMKAAFDEIFRSPYIARVLVAELDPIQDQERFFTVDVDGSFASRRESAAVAGVPEADRAIVDRLQGAGGEADSLEVALEGALRAWGSAQVPTAAEGEAGAEEPDEERVSQVLRETLTTVRLEAAVLDRTMPTKSKFRLLSPEELEPFRARYGG